MNKLALYAPPPLFTFTQGCVHPARLVFGAIGWRRDPSCPTIPGYRTKWHLKDVGARLERV